MIYSLTSLHHEYFIQYEILTHTLNSLIRNGVDKCLVSISFDNVEQYKINQIHIDNLKTKYGDKVNFYYINCSGYICQFQHLEFLCSILNNIAYPDDTVLFCNYDVILITLPPIAEHKIISGVQFIRNVVETAQYYTWFDVENCSKSSMKFDNNLSGYVCPVNIFEMFFKLNKFNFCTQDVVTKMKNELIDVEFMDYLDKLDIYKPVEPFMLQRIFKPFGKSVPKWNTILKNGFVKLYTNLFNIEKNYKTQQYKQYIKYGSLISFGFGCSYLLAKLKR